jgi:hypothetical protein
MGANKKTPPNPVGKPASGPAASGPVPAFPRKNWTNDLRLIRHGATTTD